MLTICRTLSRWQREEEEEVKVGRNQAREGNERQIGSSNGINWWCRPCRPEGRLLLGRKGGSKGKRDERAYEQKERQRTGYDNDTKDTSTQNETGKMNVRYHSEGDQIGCSQRKGKRNKETVVKQWECGGVQ